MNILSKIIVVLGLLVTGVGNVYTYITSQEIVYGIEHNATEGTGRLAWALSANHSWSLVGLVGCVILGVGLVLMLFARPRAT